MNELKDLVPYFVDVLKRSETFVLAQAPDFIRQLIEYSIFLNSTMFIVCIWVFILIFIVGIICFIRNEGPVGAFYIIISIISMIVAISCKIELAQIEMAPKVWIIEYLTSHFIK